MIGCLVAVLPLLELSIHYSCNEYLVVLWAQGHHEVHCHFQLNGVGDGLGNAQLGNLYQEADSRFQSSNLVIFCRAINLILSSVCFMLNFWMRVHSKL